MSTISHLNYVPYSTQIHHKKPNLLALTLFFMATLSTVTKAEPAIGDEFFPSEAFGKRIVDLTFEPMMLFVSQYSKATELATSPEEEDCLELKLELKVKTMLADATIDETFSSSTETEIGYSEFKKTCLELRSDYINEGCTPGGEGTYESCEKITTKIDETRIQLLSRAAEENKFFASHVRNLKKTEADLSRLQCNKFHHRWR